MKLNDYKIVLYRQEDGSWVAEVPAISGCYALMPTRDEALSELSEVFGMIEQEYREKGCRAAQGHHRDRSCLTLLRGIFSK